MTEVEDPVLGRMTWREVYASHTWACSVAIGGRTVEAHAVPESGWDPLSSDSLAAMRSIVEWLRGNEPVLRERIGAELFEVWQLDYADPETDAGVNAEAWAARLRLGEISFLSNGLAHLVYDFDTTVGRRSVWLTLSPSGEITGGPGFPW
jgi:hypothetical protein